MKDNELLKKWIPNPVYHVTPKENSQSILSKGILINTKGQSFLNRTYATPRVYLATSLIAAYDIQLNFNSHDEKDYIILEIDTNKIKGPFFEDELFVHGIYTESSIPRAAITRIISPDSLIFNDEDLDNMYNTPWMDYDAPEPTIRDYNESISIPSAKRFKEWMKLLIRN